MVLVAIRTARKRIVFSNSRIDVATGRARVSSSFVAEVLLAARGSGTDLKAVIKNSKVEETKIGWSAPNDLARCIDNVEYDLATLRQAIIDKRAGGYAWIGKINSHTTRAIETRAKRWHKSWSVVDGFMPSNLFPEPLLAEVGPKQKAYSVSSLQEFCKCPYRFYLSEVARVKPMTEPQSLDHMTPTIRGRIFHQVLFETKAGRDIYLMDEALARVAASEAELCAPPIRAIWDSDIEKIRADLVGWIATRPANWEPAYVELAFGLADLSNRDAASVADPVSLADGFKVKGSIDLVEKDGSGRVRIVDHKTGKFPHNLRNTVIDGGKILQPAIYTQLFEILRPDSVRESLLAFSTVRGGYKSIAIQNNAEAKRRTALVLGLINDSFSERLFPQHPVQKHARHANTNRCAALTKRKERPTKIPARFWA